MGGYAAAVAAIIVAAQAALLAFQTYLGFGAYLCPSSASIDTVTSIESFHYIMVGAGEAGSILVYRMSEKFPGANFLVLEAGGCPPLESLMPGYFTMLPRSSYDSAMNFYNDSYTCQGQQATDGVTAGKMLGGSGSMNHMIHIPPNPKDYKRWAEAAGDPSWGFPDFAKYFARGETVQDEGVLAQNTSYHGTSGPTLLNRQQSTLMKDVINAHTEMGIEYMDDVNGLCLVSPLLYMGDGMRQNGNVAYLSKMIGRSNVYFLTGATVNKILFDGTTATGVQYTHGGTTYNATATTNVIISAGAIITPQLLQVSGIGDADLLTALGTNIIVNNPEVGKNLMDHPTTMFGVSLNEASVSTTAVNPHEFPVPTLTNFDALNKTQTQPERQDIIVFFPPSSSGFLQLCTNVFKYVDSICDAWYEYNIDKDLIIFVSKLLQPSSRGSVTAQTTNINDQPMVKLGLFSDTKDLDKLAMLVERYVESIINTATLKRLGAKFADIGLCTDYAELSFEFWKCYIIATSTPSWHFGGTAAMGKVVDASMNVIGTKNLKVVDASVIPYLTSGHIAAAVRAMAEKSADIMIKENCGTRPFC